MGGKDADLNSLSRWAGGKAQKHFCALPISVKSIDEEARAIRVLASSASKDRDGEILLPSAFKQDLPIYLQNPVVLACHTHRTADARPPVVGHCLKVWIDRAGLWAVIKFARTQLAEDYWILYRDGAMRAVSVGFRPLEWHEERIDGEVTRVYDRVELLEISCVPVPSNRDALVRSAGGGGDWLEDKREARLLDEIRAEYKAEGRDFDAECDEFGELLYDFDAGDVGTCDFLAAAGVTGGDDPCGFIAAAEGRLADSSEGDFEFVS